MIGLDTTTIIDLFKGNPDAKKKLVEQKGPYASTILNYQELIFGLNPENPIHKKEGGFYDELFDVIRNLGITKESCKHASKIKWLLKTQGQESDRFDSIIAAIFLTNNITTIITRNEKHFKKIPHLKVITY